MQQAFVHMYCTRTISQCTFVWFNVVFEMNVIASIYYNHLKTPLKLISLLHLEYTRATDIIDAIAAPRLTIIHNNALDRCARIKLHDRCEICDYD